MNAGTFPLISVIVPTRNRAALLARLLDSLATLRYPSWEVIVVDDGSTDDTAWVVERYRGRGLPVQYFYQSWQKMGAARNLALRHARGEIVAFTDDDCVADPGWLEAVAAAFAANPEAMGIQGKTITDHAAMTPFTRQVEQLEGGQPYRTCNIAYRTEILRELGGFDPELIRGEDVVMGMRVLERGRRSGVASPIVFAPDAVVTHPPRPKEWANRAAWRTLLESEVHFKRTYPRYLPARSPTLSLQKPEHVLSRWVLLPVRRYWRWHYAYFRRHPLDYLRQVPKIIAEKLALFSLLPYFIQQWWASGSGRNLAHGPRFPLGALLRWPIQRTVSPGGAPDRGRFPQSHTGMIGDRGRDRETALHPSAQNLLTDPCPLISVVVPTRNRGHLLPRLLAALDAQDYPIFEVVVVDDASTDETPAILRRWGRERRTALRLETPGGSYAARNLGWQRSRGKIVAFTDDDCLPEPGWLAALARHMGDTGVVGVQGMTLAQPGEVTPFTHQVEQTRGGPPYRTCNIAYRRETLVALDGFDDRLRWYADNIFGLYARQRGPIVFAADAVVLHPPRPKEWRDRQTWLARFAADAEHRRHLQALGLESRMPAGLLPILLWVVRPLLKQSLAHLRYAVRHPMRYVRQLPPLLRDKWELLRALRERSHVPRPRVAGRAKGGPPLGAAPTDPSWEDHLPPLAEHPLISVVVVTRDRPALLSDLLHSLTRQTWGEREVIVVDHGSSPTTRRAAEGAGARYVEAVGTTLGAARQRGVEAARGQIVAFTDDDCIPDARWLESLVRAFHERPELLGVQGKTVAERGPVGAHTVRVAHPDPLYHTCNIAYRREALARAHGFDPGFQGWFEDTALGARVRGYGPIGWAPEMLVTHRAVPRQPLGRKAWRDLLRDERRLARNYRSFYRRTRGPGFLPTVVLRWLIGSPLKTLLRDLPGARHDRGSYLALLARLIQERRELLLALRDVLQEKEGSARLGAPSSDEPSVAGQAR